MPITIKDVARESGVNVSTVSRALNGEYGVHAGTREHVLAVAERLRYRPNRVARGAEDAAYAASYDLVLCNSDLDPEKQLRYVQWLMEKRVDGILMNSVAAPRNAFSTICADNHAGGALAGAYLWRLGHRKIAHLTGPRHHGNMTGRAQGFVRSLAEARRPVKPVVLHGRNNFQGGEELARKLLAGHPEVTAIFAGSDMMAFGVIRALRQAGRRIPEDVSVIGFDNVELSTIVNPSLTTIHQPKYEIGQAAVEILVRFAGRGAHKAPEHRLFGVRLVERQSCMERKS